MSDLADPPARPGPASALGWWDGKRVARARRTDAVSAGLLLGLALVAILAGHRAMGALRPARSAELSAFVDDLERPRRLPDAPVVDGTGGEATLLGLLGDQRGVVAFYASWCGPCQEELPMLLDAVDGARPVVVLTSDREDPVETRRKLDNLGLEDVPFHVDVTGAIVEAGRVDALPTTFVISPRGRVLERFEGARWLMMMRVEAVLGLEGDDR